MKTAIVGFSVNPELTVERDDTPGPKKGLRRCDPRLSGSSGDAVVAMKKLGTEATLLGLVSADLSWVRVLLQEVIEESGVDFHPVPVLADTNFAILPIIEGKNDEVWGRRNPMIEEKVTPALQEIAKLHLGENTFAVVTGLRQEEIPFAETLLSLARKGFRVLNAKDTFCGREEFFSILSHVDMLVLNQREFEATEKSLDQLHAVGPRVIVVTRDKAGGLYSVSGEVRTFQPESFGESVFETGAGDWFLGALISELSQIGESAHSVTLKDFGKVIHFAAKVAGLKVTMPGSSNGPSRAQIP